MHYFTIWTELQFLSCPAVTPGFWVSQLYPVWLYYIISLVFNCSKSTIKTIEKIWHLLKINSKNIRTTLLWRLNFQQIIDHVLLFSLFTLINANWFFKCEWYGIIMILKRQYIEFLVLHIVNIISRSFLYSWYFISRFSFVSSWYFINRFGFFRFIVNSLVFNCSKWTMKTIKKLWHLFKINNINIKNTNINININFIVTLFKCFYYWLWADFRTWSGVSVINFGQVNTYWDVYINDDTGEMKYWVSLLKTYEIMKEK